MYRILLGTNIQTSRYETFWYVSYSSSVHYIQYLWMGRRSYVSRNEEEVSYCSFLSHSNHRFGVAGFLSKSIFCSHFSLLPLWVFPMLLLAISIIRHRFVTVFVSLYVNLSSDGIIVTTSSDFLGSRNRDWLVSDLFEMDHVISVYIRYEWMSSRLTLILSTTFLLFKLLQRGSFVLNVL